MGRARVRVRPGQTSSGRTFRFSVHSEYVGRRSRSPTSGNQSRVLGWRLNVCTSARSSGGRFASRRSSSLSSPSVWQPVRSIAAVSVVFPPPDSAHRIAQWPFLTIVPAWSGTQPSPRQAVVSTRLSSASRSVITQTSGGRRGTRMRHARVSADCSHQTPDGHVAIKASPRTSTRMRAQVR